MALDIECHGGDDDSDGGNDKMSANSSMGVSSFLEEIAFLYGFSTYWGLSGLFSVLIRFITDHVLSSDQSVCVGFEGSCSEGTAITHWFRC